MIPRRDSGPSRLPPPLYTPVGNERPYRFSFYSNTLSATIHARTLSELPAEGQSFDDLFHGSNLGGEERAPEGQGGGNNTGRPNALPDLMNGLRDSKTVNEFGVDPCTWWLDVTSPTDEEMKLLSKVGCEAVIQVVPNRLYAGILNTSTHDRGHTNGRITREDRAVSQLLSRLFPQLRPGRLQPNIS